ncbi:transporter substrate-binding domain-containing protein [Pseudoalteromonas sp. C2R02]|uniref:substrate-binding periplasmic protein n=1 Tax=Pseudoalteromonas sp. C2R02 TaxID=2841565 RepID=UPI001C09DDB3|nr:transporter substrate-binding domain-containing protein [Pseudoalteromonas sp. C2R02]MBU2969182.1 transporter substrate-binding domain-containing protein [Pseudoalteromonas sp. C2R02]
MKTFLIIFMALNSFVAIAKEYHFVAINNLIEQEVGTIVLPEVYKQLGISISITPLPGKRAQHQATSGMSDGEIMRIYSYGIENPTTIRVPTPYYQLETMAFIRKDSGIKITKKADLAQYDIAKVRGVKHTNNITQGLTNVTDVNSTEKVMKLVSEGLADVGLTNTVDGLMVLKNLKLDNVVSINKPLATLDLFHYIHESQKVLVPLVDQKLQALIKNGELARIIKKAESAVITLKEQDYK